jgi:hypothetical protein
MQANDKLSCRAESDFAIREDSSANPIQLALTRTAPAPCYAPKMFDDWLHKVKDYNISNSNISCLVSLVDRNLYLRS